MATIKEYREFFLRNTQVSSGIKADQELGFPTQYIVNNENVYNRFLKENIPSENVYKKLYESLTFKLNVEDTSTLTTQGLSLIATDDNARNRVDSSPTSYTSFVVPFQLPDFVSSTGSQNIAESNITTDGIKVTSIRSNISSRNKRNFMIEAQVQNSVIINSVSKRIELQNDTLAPGVDRFYGTNGSGVKGFYNLTAFVNNSINALIPSGVIVMWSGLSIPSGWSLCDGTNSTPDLRGRFVVSSGQNSSPASGDLNPNYSISSTGGENTHQLTYNELPPHSHGIVIPTCDNAGGGTQLQRGNPQVATSVIGSDNSVFSNSSMNTESTYVRHENRPPYYVLAFIMKM